jgi:hypothetical protein
METPKPEKQTLVHRLFWFGIGGLISVMLNWGPFRWLKHSGMTEPLAIALSLSFATVLMAIWNYHINFKTDSHFHECLPRYLGSLIVCALISYALTLTGVKSIGQTGFSSFLVFFFVQGFISIPKFLLYHYWVYPQTKA